MTYRELNDCLSKCESTLLQIKNGEYKSSNDNALKLTTEKLNILKESLTRQIKEADETMFVSTKGGTTKAVSMDRKTAMDLKSDSSITGIESSKGQKIKEEEGAPVEFTVEETKQIARSTGKALAKSLKDLGDEVAHMKAIEIVANTFKIDIEYKDNQSDSFSFDIVGSSLHIMNDGEDAELINVGIKPSGEALVNIDVLTNELTKFFKSVNEGEISEAPAGVHYIKVENSELLEALGILEIAFDDSKVNFELNDPNIIYIHNADNGDMHDAVEELQQNGIIIDETSIDSELDLDDYNTEVEEEIGEEWAFNEGCLSIPDVREDVSRHERIKIHYFDQQFKEQDLVLTGLAARVVQHEYDHIEGVLFTDHLTPLKRRLLKNRLNSISKGTIQVDYPMKFPNKSKR